MSPEERLSSRLRADSNGCLVWQGHVNSWGYGKIFVNGKTKYVHRYAYEIHQGAIPAGLVIDHLCRNTRCCNPAHMEPVTNRENLMRGTSFSAQNAKKMHCDHGHPFNKTNTYTNPDGTRACRACIRRSSRNYYARKKAVQHDQ